LNRFRQLYEYIEAHKPHTVLEIGTWNGHNAARMFSEGAKKYIGFDLWEDGDEVIDDLENNAKKRVTLEETQKFLKSFDVELIKGNSRETLKEFVKGKKPFVDLVLIDGGHSVGTIKSDFLTVLPIVNATGVIFLDDYYYNCPVRNVGAQSVLCNVQVPYTVLPLADRARDGSIIKLVKINARDIPRGNQWDMPEGDTWQFKPAA
jgi:predicted O-methyltransferase YrrM